MRHTLVVLYFAAIYYILRPAPPLEIQAPPEPESSVRPEASRPSDSAAAPPKRNWEPPTRAMPDPIISIASASPDLPAAASPASKSIVQTLESADEQRVSTNSTTELQEGPVEQQMQRELARLSCLIGKPEKVWGKKSRAAMRRFARRAKIKDANLDAAMLRMMRGYPANYCKTCRPGRAACDIVATGATPKKSATVAATTATDRPGQALDAATAGEPGSPPTTAPATAGAATSYLPPWMSDETGAKADDESPSNEQEAVTPKPKKKARRRRPSRSVNTPRRRHVAPSPYRGYGGAWPRMGGWSNY